MPKFRSMVTNAERLLPELLLKNDHKDGVLFKMKNDPRVTWIGRFIRRFSIDELPQLWCVLVGDMSLVGPRPPLPREVVLYSLAHRLRLEVVPGLTCIWQVSGRSLLPFAKQVEMDVEYAEKQNFWFDLQLLFRTIPAVLFPEGSLLKPACGSASSSRRRSSLIMDDRPESHHRVHGIDRMRALLLATGDASDSNPMMQRHLVPMLPLLDRPFVQHVIEYCIGQGIKEFDIVLSHLPEVLERHLGDGARWGCRVTYHLARDPGVSLRSAVPIGARVARRISCVAGPCRPLAHLPDPAGQRCQRGQRLAVRLGSPWPWAARTWERVDGMGPPACPRPADDIARPARGTAVRPPAVRRSRMCVLAEVSTVLSVRTPAELLAAERAMLDKKIGGLMFRGREKAPGMWVARSAAISPKAELNGPVFIGPHSVVGAARTRPARGHWPGLSRRPALPHQEFQRFRWHLCRRGYGAGWGRG